MIQALILCGLVYTGSSFYDLVPQISLQGSIISREKVIDELKSFYVSSYSLQTSLRGYSDPVVHSLHIAFSYNLDRQFEFIKIRYGNSFYVGGDLSIVLAYKITLNLGKVSRSAKDKWKAKFRVSFSSYAFIRFYL